MHVPSGVWLYAQGDHACICNACVHTVEWLCMYYHHICAHVPDVCVLSCMSLDILYDWACTVMCVSMCMYVYVYVYIWQSFMFCECLP